MTTNSLSGSATIYQFPLRGRFAAGAPRHEADRAAAEALPKIAYGSGWYHDEAIEAEAARKN